MRPYLAVLSARFRMLLQYRAAALAGAVCQFFWGGIRMMIYMAFYEHAAAESPIALDQVITYVWLGQAFFSLYPIWIDRDVAGAIRSGDVAYELLRPVDLYGLWYSRALASRAAPVALRAGPILVVALAAGLLQIPTLPALGAFVLSMAAAALLSASIATVLTVSMFWTISGQGIHRLSVYLVYVLGGMVIPLPLWPEWLQPALRVLPFRGLGDVPYRLYAGHIPVSDLPAMLAHQLAWTLGFVLLGRHLLARGVRRAVIHGG